MKEYSLDWAVVVRKCLSEEGLINICIGSACKGKHSEWFERPLQVGCSAGG